MASFKFVQNQASTLAGAGAVIGETEVVLSSFTGIDGDLLTMTDFGDKGFVTLEPNSGTQEEQCSFSGITQNVNGTATLTGIKTVLFVSPYTEVSGFAKSHSGGVKLVVTNTSGFYNTFLNKDDDATISGLFDFVQVPIIEQLPINPTDATNKEYVDSVALSGAPNASTSVQGVVQEATTAQLNAGTDTGSTGAKLFGSPADFAASIYGLQLPNVNQKAALASTQAPTASNLYITQKDTQRNLPIFGVDSVGTDAYAITLTPAIASYVTGMAFYVQFGTANTGPATLAVGSGAAKAIVKGYNNALVTGDILQHQIGIVAYNSTNDNWQLLSPVAPTALTTTSAYTCGAVSKNAADASTAQTLAHGLGTTPKYVRITLDAPSGTAIGFAQATTVYNGSTQIGASYYITGAFSDATTTAFILNTSLTSGTQTGVVTFDATNITITWTKSGSPTGTYNGFWEAFGPTT